VETTGNRGREERLYGILLVYLEAAERGEALDSAELFDSQPEFAAELHGFLESWDRLQRLTAPLRQALHAASRRREQGGQC
jgi:hypothetical protein